MAHFKVQNIRVPKIDGPLLIIGLGGTGADALLNIKRKFKERFELPVVGGEVQDKPARTAYLAIDTDLQELSARSVGEVSLRTSEKFGLEMPDLENLIKNPAEMMAWEKSWWDKRVPPTEAGNGAGGVRQVGRLLLFRNANRLVQTLQQTIRHLMQLDRTDTSDDLNVVIVTGISGGTGSGIFLDLAYLIRHVMENHFIGVKFRIQAYVILPGVNLDRINLPTESKIRLLKTNGFAALKELDYWMNWKQHKHEHHQTYADNIHTVWNRKPFDEVVLLGEKKEDGSVITNAYHAVLDTLAEFLMIYFANHAPWPMYRIPHFPVMMPCVEPSFPVNHTYLSLGIARFPSIQYYMLAYQSRQLLDQIASLLQAGKLSETIRNEEGCTKLLKEARKELNAIVDEQWQDIQTQMSIVHPDGINRDLDEKMAEMARAGKLDEPIKGILEQLENSSFAHKHDDALKGNDRAAAHSAFLAFVDRCVKDLTRDMNSLSMDQILAMILPEAPDQEMIRRMLAELSHGALPLLHLQDNMSHQFLRTNLASIPEDTQLAPAAWREHGIDPPLTLSNSTTIQWIVKISQIPLVIIHGMGDLECEYEKSLEQAMDQGIHLVQNRESPSSLHHNWQHLPSPIPHVLLGGDEAKISDRLKEHQEKYYAVLDEALKTQFVQLLTSATGDSVQVRIKRNANGTIMEPEVFEEQANTIFTNDRTNDDEKLAQLTALRDAGNAVPFECGNFSPAFANALNLKTAPQDGTNAERERAEAAALKASWTAAKYFMLSQHPDVVEIIDKQLQMFRHVNQLIDQVKQRMAGEDVYLTFVKPFMHLLVFDQFKWGRNNVEFTNVAGQSLSLFTNNELNDTEMSLYSYCKPLVLMRILADDTDTRIDDNDRRYLKDKAQQLIEGINDIPEADYQAAQAKAREFADTYKDTAKQLEYDRGDLSRSIRTQNAALMDRMVRETRVFLL